MLGGEGGAVVPVVEVVGGALVVVGDGARVVGGFAPECLPGDLDAAGAPFEHAATPRTTAAVAIDAAADLKVILR